MRVLIFGTFDLLHPGHHFLLREGESRGELHVVVARDLHVQELKGRLPKQNEHDRLAALEKAYPNAKIRLGDSEDFLAPVRAIKPDLILLGYDQKLPPGVSAEDLPCPIERLGAFEPEKWKSSLRRTGS